MNKENCALKLVDEIILFYGRLFYCVISISEVGLMDGVRFLSLAETSDIAVGFT